MIFVLQSKKNADLGALCIAWMIPTLKYFPESQFLLLRNEVLYAHYLDVELSTCRCTSKCKVSCYAFLSISVNKHWNKICWKAGSPLWYINANHFECIINYCVDFDFHHRLLENHQDSLLQRRCQFGIYPWPLPLLLLHLMSIHMDRQW